MCLFNPIFLCKIWFTKSTKIKKFTQKICFPSLRKWKSIFQITFAAFPFLFFKSSASEGSTLHTDFILISYWFQGGSVWLITWPGNLLWELRKSSFNNSLLKGFRTLFSSCIVKQAPVVRRSLKIQANTIYYARSQLCKNTFLLKETFFFISLIVFALQQEYMH